MAGREKSTAKAEEVVVSSRIANLYADLERAIAARAEWQNEEARLKAAILAELGYVDDESKPTPRSAYDPDGHQLFRVTIGTWRGIDTKYLKSVHPDVYAECETSKPTKKIQGPEL
jgi:hypothetical protein